MEILIVSSNVLNNLNLFMDRIFSSIAHKGHYNIRANPQLKNIKNKAKITVSSPFCTLITNKNPSLNL